MKNTVKIAAVGDCEITIARTVEAPRAIVWQALNKPEFLRRWLLGPPGWDMTVCENDPRVGGTFRHVWRQADGTEMAMNGVYQEIAEPSRIVRTERFEFGCAPQMGEQLATMTLTETNGRTEMAIHLLFPSKEARDGMIASGMERGVSASYDRLEDLVKSM